MKYWSKSGRGEWQCAIHTAARYTWDRDHDQIWHIPIVPVKVIDPNRRGKQSTGADGALGGPKRAIRSAAGCYGTVSASFLVERVGLPIVSPELREEAKRRLEHALNDVKPL